MVPELMRKNITYYNRALNAYHHIWVEPLIEGAHMGNILSNLGSGEVLAFLKTHLVQFYIILHDCRLWHYLFLIRTNDRNGRLL